MNTKPELQKVLNGILHIDEEDIYIQENARKNIPTQQVDWQKRKIVNTIKTTKR
jgi:hypothetical protein